MNAPSRTGVFMQAVSEEITLEQQGDIARFGNDRIVLEIERATGRWRSLTDRSDGAAVLRSGDLSSPILLTINGRTQTTRGYNQMFTLTDTETVGLHWKCEGISCREGEDCRWLVTHLSEADWRVEIRYGLQSGQARLERQVRIEYTGEGEPLLRYFELRQPFAVLGSPYECRFEAPGYHFKPGRRVCHLPYGAWAKMEPWAFADCPAWNPPLVGIHHPESRRAVAFWAHTETEPFYPLVNRSDQGVQFSH